VSHIAQMSHCILSTYRHIRSLPLPGQGGGWGERGAIAIVAGFSLVLVLGFAALVIDLGYGLVVRNTLQNVADGASLAAARELGRIYKEELPEEEISSYQLTALHRDMIVSKAIEAGQENIAAGKAVLINETDITIGQWDFVTKTLTVSDNRPDAVRVMTRRDTLGNGPIYTFFAGIMGWNSMAVAARATAALSGLGYVKPGTIETPVGISEKLLDCSTAGPGCFCGTSITFSDTKDSCAGWTTFHQDPNTPNLLDILDEMINGEDVAPAVQAGKTELEYTGGNLGSQPWSRLKELYDEKNVGGVWTTTVVVYEEASTGDCDNPNELTRVVGFAKINITAVLVQPNMEIEGHIACNTVEDGRGGGSNLGVLGSIPNLVQ
jgi:hypothetical protein